MRDDDKTVDVEVERIITETEKALLVVIDGAEVWMPKNQIHDDSECYSLKSGPGTMTITRWIAEQKGLL
jgi:hypothetical protein